jgi:hypothetical protein
MAVKKLESKSKKGLFAASANSLKMAMHYPKQRISCLYLQKKLQSNPKHVQQLYTNT